jgi:aminoglycoside phosphotransferase (APT) family kinase protein
MHDPTEMPARLAAFLAEQEPDWTDIEVTSYEVMTGGYSRLLARAEVRHADGTHTFVLRGDPPADKTLLHTDRQQEWDLVRALNDHGVRTPTGRYYDHGGEGLGTRALIIDFSEASSFLPYAAGGGSVEGLNITLADALASFHSMPIDRLPPQFERRDSWDSYMTTRIDEWRRTAEAHIEELPVMRYLAGWLDAHRPVPVPLTLTHGDFQGANLMVMPDGHFEILDWELASIGDPREDMGYFKAVAQISPPDLLDDAGCDAFCARYRELTGLNELQVNPAVVAYFLILGVVGTVRQLLEGGSDYAHETNHLFTSVFSLSAVVFGQSVWLPTTAALGPVLQQLAAAANEIAATEGER